MNDTLLNSQNVKIIAAVGWEGRGRHSAGKCQSLWVMQPSSTDLLCPFSTTPWPTSNTCSTGQIPKSFLHYLTPNESFCQCTGSVAGLPWPALSYSLCFVVSFRWLFSNANQALLLAHLWIEQPCPSQHTQP